MSADAWVVLVVIGAVVVLPATEWSSTVVGLGGYRFGDFTRVGLPLTITSALTATLALSI